MPTYAIDFETYYNDASGYTLKRLCPEKYCADPQFDPYLVSLSGPGVSYVGPLDGAPWVSLDKNPHLVAHNARFDETVFLAAQKRGMIPQGVSPSWDCTADLACYLKAGRSLLEAANDLLGQKLDKKMRDKMARLGYKEACARGMKEELHAYALSDASTCLAIWDGFASRWPDFERRISRLNRESGRFGMAIDIDRLQAGIGNLETAKWEAAKGIPWEWEESKTPLKATELMRACVKEGIPCPASVAEDSEECAAWEAEYGPRFPWVANLRRWRKAHYLVKKLYRIRDNLIDGIYPFQLLYGGAHTLRFSGAGGFNMQNMHNDELEGVSVRGLFIPRSGHGLLAPDYSQIEARILQWFAGNESLLEKMRDGMSIYEAYARTTNVYAGEGKLKDVDPALYKLIKARVLACGYAMGPDRYRAQAREKYGLELSIEEAKRDVYGFREDNPAVVSLWHRLNRDMIWSGQRNEDYEMCLPSGRSMVYRNIRSTKDGWEAQFEINGNHRKLYGGKLAENLVQATARDVMCEGMLRLHDAGYRVLFSVHDEIIIEAPPTVDQNHVRELLITPPDWLKGCPLDVEMKVLERYE